MPHPTGSPTARAVVRGSPAVPRPAHTAGLPRHEPGAHDTSRTHSGGTDRMTRAGPRFVVVSDDPTVCNGLVADLERRFGRDYEVTGGSSAAAEDLLERSALEDRPVALLIVDERLSRPSALE